MRKIKYLTIIMISFVVSGCWNYHELNDLSIANGMSFDINDDKYILSYIIANPKKDKDSSEDSNSSFSIYSGEGDSINSAYEVLNNKIAKTPYIGHIDIVIISEDLAKKGVSDVIDFLMHNKESRKQFYLALAKDSSAVSILESLASSNDFSTIKKNNLTMFVEQYNSFVIKLLDPGVNPILSSIEIDSEVNPKAIVSNFGLFKNDVLVGWANYEQSMGIKVLNNNARSILLETTYDGEYVASNLNNIKSNIKVSFINDIPKFNIYITADGVLTQINCNCNLENKDVFNELENEFENKLNKIIKNSISSVQKEYKTDVFGYGNYIYKNYYQKWKELANNWYDQVFPNLDIEISTKINLKGMGMSKQSLKENT